MIDALLALLNEGDHRLSVDDVATRAGVSAASVFRYFDSLDELHRQAFEHQLELVQPMLHIPALSSAAFEARVDAFVRGRLDVYEVIAGAARTGRWRAVDHPVLADSLERARRLWLRQVREVFAMELSPLGRTGRHEIAALVDTITSFEAWDLLGRAHQLSRPAIERAWRTTVTGTLVPEG